MGPGAQGELVHCGQWSSSEATEMDKFLTHSAKGDVAWS